MRGVDHFLLWHCTFLGHAFNVYDDKQGSSRFASDVTNFDVRGCVFAEFKEEKPKGYTDLSGFDQNHFITGPTSSDPRIKAPGTGVTLGNPGLDSQHRPTGSSPLRSRVSPKLVPTDAAGDSRPYPAAVGARER